MRFLLQVIAGLLLSEYVTKSIVIWHQSRAWVNTLVLLGAGMFLFRLFVDNLLFYEASDRTIERTWEYVTRLFLLALDLASYVVCYDIVFRLGRLAARTEYMYTTTAVRQVMCAIALVEVFHFFWSLGAMAADKTWGNGDSTERFQLWMLCSGGTAIGMSVVAVYAVAGQAPLTAALWFIAASSVSLFAYLCFMQAQYRKVVR